MKVFVTGGTGLVGGRLVRALKDRGDEVSVLSRRAGVAREQFPGCTIIEGDPMQAGAWQDALAGCDGVVHLAGENIFARRWSDDFKKLIRDSRVLGTQSVVAALARQPKTAAGNPKVLVNASAVGYYGPRGDEIITEGGDAGSDFLAKACVEWEQAAKSAESHGVRVAIVRIGVVLDQQGGALAKMLTPFKLGVGGKVGSGQQWMAWVHIDDLAGLFLLALDNTAVNGPLNGTAPKPVTNYDFTKALGAALGRPTILPTPAFGLRLMLGEVADVITTGQRVVPQKALDLGYQFKFPDIDRALKDIFK
jgi:uncharacterized protein (TIGR01777 family)